LSDAGWFETFDGAGCRHGTHRVQVHDPDHEKDRLRPAQQKLQWRPTAGRVARNDAAAPNHVCPGIRIHVIDIAQPPGIGISPIADMDAHQTIVTAAQAAKSNAETPKKACWEARSETMRPCDLPTPGRANDTSSIITV
jgi:hypothetical protein